MFTLIFTVALIRNSNQNAWDTVVLTLQLEEDAEGKCLPAHHIDGRVLGFPQKWPPVKLR